MNFNKGDKIEKIDIQKKITELEGNKDATLSDLTSGTKEIKEKETNLEKETVELYEKKLRDFCYSFISLNIAIEKSEDIPFIEKELEEQGINITSKDLKNIDNVFLNKLSLTKEQIDNLKRKFTNEKEKEESFEDFLKKNDSLDNIMLYEICVKKVKKGVTFGEEYTIKNKILDILSEYDDFNDKKNTWTVLKKETEKGKYKNQIRMLELEQQMEETYNRKVKTFLSDKYRDIFIRNNN